MKRTLRPLYSVLLLLMMAATLTIRVVLQQNGSFQLKYEFSPARTHKKPVFNATLLKHAAVDIGEPRLKREIDDLLEGNFRSSRGRQRTFLSSGKYHIDVKLRSARGTPLQLRSPEFYRLWLSFRRYLSDWWRNRRFYSDVMSDLVNEIRVPIDEHNGKKVSRGRYKSCAVVGNSGILMKSDYGKLIDSHEAVIRLNNARIRSFERNVGSKTNISFVNSNILHLCARREGCFCQPYGKNVPMIMYICQPAHFLDYLVCNSSHKALLIITDPKFDVLCSRIVKYYSMKRFVELTGKDFGEWAAAHEGANFHYSSGMQAVMLALGVCEKVSVFGFGKSNLARHHYHTNQKAELSLHDYEAEYDFYRDLMERPEEILFIILMAGGGVMEGVPKFNKISSFLLFYFEGAHLVGEGPAVGIDLGTTYSCVGVWQHDRVEIIADDRNKRMTPSYVAFRDNERLIGDEAMNQVAMNPVNTVFDAKRIMGRRFSDCLLSQT